MKDIKILLADDHHLFLEGLKGMLDQIPEFEITAVANDGLEVLNILKINKVDVVLLDIQMPVLNGFETSERILKLYPDIKIIVLSMHNERAFIRKMHKSNVHGYLLKTCTKSELFDAIQIVHQGGKYFSPDIILTLLENDTDKKSSYDIDGQLSKREKEILMLIARGQTNQEIAQTLHKSIHTINSHRKNILSKLGVKNTAGLVSYAIKNNLI